MEFRSKDGKTDTFFNDFYNKNQFHIQKTNEERKYRQDNTKYYELGKTQERPYFDIFEYKYGTNRQPYYNGTIWKDKVYFRPYPDNEPIGLLPRYVESQNNKIIDVSGVEIRNSDLFKKIGRVSTQKF